MMWFWGLVLLSVTPFGSTYYHELSNKTIKVTEDNVYFGYSIAYEPTKKLLITSAPLSKYTGKIYVCDIDNTRCSTIRTNFIDSQYNKEYEQSMWLGAVVKAAPTYFVTCAPLAISSSIGYSNKNGSYGQCFYGDVKDLSKLNRLTPISDDDRLADANKMEEAMDSFGWSIDIIDKSKSFLVGGPAMVQGRVEKYDDFVHAAKHINGDRCDIRHNFGYSIASGLFINDTITYAVGSTYENGKVVFINSQLQKLMDLPKGTDKNVIGSMYGAVLCTASFTGNQKDLLVGAPTYADKNTDINRGAVYVYTRNNNYKELRKDFPEFKRKIVGETDDSFFGSAIVNVGDLNKDDKDEIAIGAPYEYEDRGTVYIYSGADILQADSLVPLQKIKPENTGWMTFGFSLSALEDYDDNGCNELAIGAPGSDKIMVLRCMASVYVEVEPKIPNLQNWRMVKNNPVRNATHLMFESCLKVTYPEKPKTVTATIHMNVEVIHEDVRLANPKEADYDISLNKAKKEYCRNITVVAPEDGNYKDAIEIIINARHIDDPIKNNDFHSSQVRLSDQSKRHSRTFLWAAECKNNTCSPKLVHNNTKLSIMTEHYIIGSTDSIAAAISIDNTGDPAYDACLQLHVDGARFLQATNACARVKGGDLLCTPNHLLRTGDRWNIDNIIIETKHLTSKDEIIRIEGTIYNHCYVKNESSTFENIIPLMRDYLGVSVTGVTNTGIDDFVNMTTTDITIGKVFEHVYKINNFGKTTWVGLTFKLIVQKLNFIKVKSVSHQPGVHCIDERETETEKVFQCSIEELGKNVITVSVPIRVLPNSVDDLIQKQNLTVNSNMVLDLKIEERHAKVTSTLMYHEVTVPFWLYICTAIAGFLILILIFFILRELGCLRRKNKDRLERVRQSVRRQTVIRERNQSQVSSNIRHERMEMSNEELQSALADAAKQKYDRRVRVSDS